MLSRRDRPIPWASQPQECVTANEIAGLEIRALFNFGEGIAPSNRGAWHGNQALDWTLSGEPTQVLSEVGLAAKGGGVSWLAYGSSNAWFERIPANSTAWIACIFTHSNYVNKGSAANVIAAYTNGAGSSGLKIQVGSDNRLTVAVEGVTAIPDFPVLVENKAYQVIAGRAVDGSIFVFMNGLAYRSGSSTSIFGWNVRLCVLNDGGTDRYSHSSVAMLALGVGDIFERGQELSENLWQLFAPIRTASPIQIPYRHALIKPQGQTLHYIVVPKGSVPPTPQQIVTGTSYGNVNAVADGYVEFKDIGNVNAELFPAMGAQSGTTYDQWWVAFDGVEYGFPVKGEVTASGSVLIPTLSLAQIINLLATQGTPRVTLTF